MESALLQKDNTNKDELYNKGNEGSKLKENGAIVFAEAEHYKVLKAIEQAVDDGIIVNPVLLGRREKIQGLIEEFSIDIENAEIIEPVIEKPSSLGQCDDIRT